VNELITLGMGTKDGKLKINLILLRNEILPFVLVSLVQRTLEAKNSLREVNLASLQNSLIMDKLFPFKKLYHSSY
jgi:hypothetical protein